MDERIKRVLTAMSCESAYGTYEVTQKGNIHAHIICAISNDRYGNKFDDKFLLQEGHVILKQQTGIYDYQLIKNIDNVRDYIRKDIDKTHQLFVAANAQKRHEFSVMFRYREKDITHKGLEVELREKGYYDKAFYGTQALTEAFDEAMAVNRILDMHELRICACARHHAIKRCSCYNNNSYYDIREKSYGNMTKTLINCCMSRKYEYKTLCDGSIVKCFLDDGKLPEVTTPLTPNQLEANDMRAIADIFILDDCDIIEAYEERRARELANEISDIESTEYEVEHSNHK